RLVTRGPIPHTSITGRRDNSPSRVVLGTRSQTQTPLSWSTFFAVSLASFAKVFVFAIPTQTGRPVSRRTSRLICSPTACSSSSVPLRPKNASSMEYTSTQAENRARTDTGNGEYRFVHYWLVLIAPSRIYPAGRVVGLSLRCAKTEKTVSRCAQHFSRG